MNRYTIFFLLFINIAVFACTTAIISGKATADGRPLLLKHRDTDDLNNKIVYFNDGKYAYLGLVNSSDKEAEAVWAGINSAGFSIMNSASYNLKINDTTELADMEGVLMKRALAECSSVDEFELFLQNYPKPRGVEANFGVIDAHGNAAYFETDNFNYTKFDVNDPRTAPHGYLIRSNYSFNGTPDKGYGYIRYNTADELIGFARASNSVSVKYIFQNVSRSLKHSLTKADLSLDLSPDFNTPKMHFFEDFIPRFSSSASFLAQGVKKGESAELTTMWIVLGFPLTSVAIPLWIKGESNLPIMVSEGDNGNALICDMALKLKKYCFPILRGSGKRYIDISKLYNQEKTGIIQKITPLENNIIDETDKKLSIWRGKGFSKKDVTEFYNWIDSKISDEYKKLFGI